MCLGCISECFSVVSGIWISFDTHKSNFHAFFASDTFLTFLFYLKILGVMDKSWIKKPRNTLEYHRGLNGFLDFAFEHSSSEGTIICPCDKCGFRKWKTRPEVFDHLICKPFPETYTFWCDHGETLLGESVSGPPIIQESIVDENVMPHTVIEDPMQNMLKDAFGFSRMDDNEEHSPSSTEHGDEGGGGMPERQYGASGAKEFYDLLQDGEQPLYEGCTKFSKLSFLVKLYHIKCLCGVSDKAMGMIIELLHEAFEHANIPASGYEAKKVINKLGLKYTKIHACPNDCMLYWGEDEDREKCKTCGTSRWEPCGKTNASASRFIATKSRKKLPAKVMRYFPLIPRLKRMFMSSKTAKSMVWHDEVNNNDGMMRHPRDSEAWKEFDRTHQDFAKDPRNVRLALASDGFNPFGSLKSIYSIWPLILIPYNTPPWMCMKPTNYILSTVIPGKRAPGNDIDIYMQPLIEELKVLWETGVETYDASRNEVFMMRACLLWTISDFPGLGVLSGWNTYTGLACPSCNFDSIPLRLPFSKKWCFMGHRRFLSKGHKFRLNKIHLFNGKIEDRDPPKALSGSDILEQVRNVEVTFGKPPEPEDKIKRTRGKKRKKQTKKPTQQWKKRSILFQLPYWEFNKLRHNLDVMHIEKNVCDNILFTLINDKEKRKDHAEARKDLRAMGIKRELWPPDDGSKFPAALFTLSKEEISVMLSTLKDITVPDGYSSNISRCVDLVQHKLFGLKSHDSHILMEQLLPLSIRNVLPVQVATVIVDLCTFFKLLCAKVLDHGELDKLKEQIVLTLCQLEMLFPPSFFTVMVHLMVHLPDEAKLGGPVHYRWMYPIERFLGKLKSYVRNQAQPEGSIAEGWISEEILTFCSRYLDNEIETRFNRGGRVDDYPYESSSLLFPNVGKPVGGSSYFTLTEREWLQAHRHVLVNCKEVQHFIEEFRIITKRRLRSRTRSSTEIEKEVHRGFVEWFRRRIMNDSSNAHSDDICALAQGPLQQARRFTAYNVNGYKFRTLQREQGMKTQNSGVFCSSGTKSYASTSDNRPTEGLVPYYGKLVDIIELSYHGQFVVTLFKCQWANTTNFRLMKKDVLGFTSISFSHLIHTGDREDDEPYIQASEGQLVYYVEDKMDEGWYTPVHLKPRDLFDMGEGPIETTYESEPYHQQSDMHWSDDNIEDQLFRPGVLVEFD